MQVIEAQSFWPWHLTITSISTVMITASPALAAAGTPIHPRSQDGGICLRAGVKMRISA